MLELVLEWVLEWVLVWVLVWHAFGEEEHVGEEERAQQPAVVLF